ncbi:hypothetical protein CVT24_003595 [Panaeolus cyanescens]|uniref:CID domain-containing protein n=1 Tax=Panaeolus cyanescens TaxID=181874 RepID=A0A409Y7H4_9AGAR|nr:hypothetical protein CVT24_003595 [Panaeolus cyanescens]
MSVYHQHQHMYGQAGPSFSSAPPPPQGGYYYQQPQPSMPPPFPIQDATSVRRMFSMRISQLNLNSRQMIQDLSSLAFQYSRFSDVVAECIRSHILKAPHWMRLPAWYLLDAIAKNLYDPYARQFAMFVVPVYLDTYRIVDASTKSKMEEMLFTWRTASPNHDELFGLAQQRAIEHGIWGGDGVNIPAAQVLSELQFAIGQKERAVQSNPYDTQSHTHIGVLHQLRRLIERGVSQHELQQILNQLRNLVKTPPAAAPPPPPAPPAVLPHNSTWQAPPTYHVPPVPGPVNPQPPPAQDYPSTSAVKIEDLLPPQVDMKPSVPQIPAVDPAGIATMLSNLIKAGVVSANSTPSNADVTVKEQEAPAPTKDKEMEIREYRESVMSENINLDTFDLSKTRPKIVKYLYERLSSQCKQCGLRFPDTTFGKKTLNDHLDMHFRQNRKAGQNIGRGHSRSWFIGLEDWIQDNGGDLKGKGRAEGSASLNSKAAVAVEIAKREADLRAQCVIVPPGHEAELVACPICKESLKSEFQEDDEEWVWRNAVKKDDRIYHATCHAEALVSTNSLAARLRTEKIYGSRDVTPEVQSAATPRSPSRSPPSDSKIIGSKRKVEQTDSSVNDEGSGTPPLKKVALTTLMSSLVGLSS